MLVSKQTFISSISNNDQIGKPELEEIIEKYPYFQSARIVLAKKARKEKTTEVKKLLVTAAVYSTNRKVLKQYLDGNINFDVIKKALKEQKTNIKSSTGSKVVTQKSKPTTQAPTAQPKPEAKKLTTSSPSQEKESRIQKREVEKRLKKDLDSMKHKILKAGDQKLITKAEAEAINAKKEKEQEEARIRATQSISEVSTPDTPNSQEDLDIIGHDEISGQVLIDDVYSNLSELQKHVADFSDFQAKQAEIHTSSNEENVLEETESPIEPGYDSVPSIENRASEDTNIEPDENSKKKSGDVSNEDDKISASLSRAIEASKKAKERKKNKEEAQQGVIDDQDMEDTLLKLSFAIGEFNKEEEQVENRLSEEKEKGIENASDKSTSGIDLEEELKLSIAEIKKEVQEEVVKEETAKKVAAEKNKASAKSAKPKATSKKAPEKENQKEPAKTKEPDSAVTKAKKTIKAAKPEAEEAKKTPSKKSASTKKKVASTDETVTEKEVPAEQKQEDSFKKPEAIDDQLPKKVSLSIGRSGMSGGGRIRKIVKIPPSYNKKEETAEEKQEDIIDKFIKEEPSLTPSSKSSNSTVDPKDLSEKSASLSDDLITENLALIYLEQNKNEKALETYEKLILKNPEKKAYFAAKIKEIKEKN